MKVIPDNKAYKLNSFLISFHTFISLVDLVGGILSEFVKSS